MKQNVLSLCIFAFFVMLFTPAFLLAQQIHQDLNNPCNLVKNLLFVNGIQDTVTIYANYNGVAGKIADDDLATLQSIHHIYGLNTGKFQYAITVTVGGCLQPYYLPCCDKGMMNAFADKKNSAAKLKLTCVAYKMFFADGGIYNFLYIDKVSFSAGESLAAK